MGNIFSTAGNETLIIYPQNNAIYLLVTKGTNPCQATVLEEDYKSNFSGFVYNQTIYYIYINLRNEIIVKNIRDQVTSLALATEDDNVPYKEALAEAKEEVTSLKELIATLQEDNATLQKSVTSMEQTIESAKEQYATLMDTATKYREEAQKWFLIAKKRKQ